MQALETRYSFPWLGLAAGGLLGVGWAVAQAGTTAAAVAAGVVAFSLLSVLLVGMPTALTVEVPLVAVLVSDLVLRIREADELAEAPLDSAGLYRVTMVALGGFLALAGLALVRKKVRIHSPPFWFYGLFVGVVFLGALASVSPSLTLFRGAELAAGFAVVIAAYKQHGTAALHRMLKVLYWFLVARVAVVWLGVLIAPQLAIRNFPESPIPWAISGVLPAYSSNTVGMSGVLLCIWSLALVISPMRSLPTGRRASLLAGLGFVTLVAAQYRTGYAALAAAIALLLLTRRHKLLALALTVLAIFALVNASEISYQEVVLRGDTYEEATQLSGRLGWWEAAVDVWQRSPLVGVGLLTGTRFEALASLGRTTTSSIHSTWIEVLVGTGLIGFVFLLSGFLVLYWKSLVFAFTRRILVPALLLTVLAVRSLTASAFEAGGYGSTIFLVLAIALWSRAWVDVQRSRASNPAPIASR